MNIFIIFKPYSLQLQVTLLSLLALIIIWTAQKLAQSNQNFKKYLKNIQFT